MLMLQHINIFWWSVNEFIIITAVFCFLYSRAQPVSTTIYFTILKTEFVYPKSVCEQKSLKQSWLFGETDTVLVRTLVASRKKQTFKDTWVRDKERVLMQNMYWWCNNQIIIYKTGISGAEINIFYILGIIGYNIGLKQASLWLFQWTFFRARSPQKTKTRQ